MYLNIYVTRLQCEDGIVGFFRHHRGNPLPSSALMKPMSREFVAKLEKFVAEHQIPLVQFHKGQRKDDVMKQHLRQFRKDEGILFVGKAQEKTPVFRTERRRSPKTGPTVSMDCAFHRDGEQLLHLCIRSRLRAVLSQVLQLLSVQCQALS